MADSLIALFGIGALLHLLLAAAYGLFRESPHRLLGVWLIVAWAVGLIRLREWLMGVADIGVESFVVWLNVLLAALACLISVWRNASDEWGRPLDGANDAGKREMDGKL